MPLDWNADGPPPPPGAPPPQPAPPPGPPPVGAAAFVPGGSGSGVGASSGSGSLRVRGVSKTAAPFIPGTSTRAPHSLASASMHGMPQAQAVFSSASTGRATRYARKGTRIQIALVLFPPLACDTFLFFLFIFTSRLNVTSTSRRLIARPLRVFERRAAIDASLTRLFLHRICESPSRVQCCICALRARRTAAAA